jgi:hypothetical protein
MNQLKPANASIRYGASEDPCAVFWRCAMLSDNPAIYVITAVRSGPLQWEKTIAELGKYHKTLQCICIIAWHHVSPSDVVAIAESSHTLTIVYANHISRSVVA